MKLASLLYDDQPKPVAVIDSGGSTQFLDLCAADPTLPDDLLGILQDNDGLARAAEAAQTAQSRGMTVTGRLVAPIGRPGKIFCIGLNYRDHALETGAKIPAEPVVFSKFANTIAGPEQDIPLPSDSSQVDFEAELVAVIGKKGKRIQSESALSHVAGYMCGNDVSARDWQKGRPGGQWLLGKTPDSFAPTGPYLVTADEIPDPGMLDIMLRLNGEVMQQSNTREFIFSLPEVIAHISRMITLEPGDIIFTGTPAGVGLGRTPPLYLKPDDVTEVEIAGLGLLRNRFVAVVPPI